MMRMKTKMSPKNGTLGGPELADWELRPGGMLVQKRNPDSDRVSVPIPAIRVKVKHGSSYHEIYISSQATFGELKKLLAETTGLHPQDQKLLFKNKERDSSSYLDIVGVKDRSKIVLVEDPTSQERRYLEMRKNAKMEKASKSISEISFEVDKLAGQVSALESVISKGGKVADNYVMNLIEMLMTQLIKLDGIVVDGDVQVQRKMQVKRVQKYVETLDLLKIRNAVPNSNGVQTPLQQQQKHSNGYMPTMSMQQQQQQKHSNGLMPTMPMQQQQQQQQQKHSNGQMPTMPMQQQQQQQQKHSNGQMAMSIPMQQQQEPSRDSASGSVLVTTKWETFDLELIPAPSTSTTQTPPKFNWDFFE